MVKKRLKPHKKLVLTILTSAFLCTSNFCYALDTDRNEALELQADSADINQSGHVGTYTGKIEFDQGTTHIRASKAITHSNDKNQITKAVLYGDKTSQAHYWATVSKDKPDMHAYADIIYYIPETNTIKLEGHARVNQGDNSFSAGTITYNTATKNITSSNMDKQKDGRTVIIFHPNENKK
ncbi:MAG: lipopolysaccharide transport periplasmic protein LptA [Legionellaceae bacterium]|nr:lipopolysaccharide transport periplasmic protein LptA [Legionellaceae bacterium]